MFSAISKLLSKIPAPWRYLVVVALVAVVIAGFFALMNQASSCSYRKARAEYDQQQKEWAGERAKLLSRAEESEKRAAALEPKAIAFDALAEQHKAIDAGLAKKVEEVSQNAANEEAKAEQPTDCRTRAQRVCDLLRTNRIKHDCGAITRESCPGQ